MVSHTLPQDGENEVHTQKSRHYSLLQIRGEGEIEIVGWYVDDGLIAANSTKSMKNILKDIKGSFNIQDLGKPTRLLGIKITRAQELGTIHISQPAFITTIAKHFNITSGRAITSPMNNSIKL